VNVNARSNECVLITGASGLVGGDVLRLLQMHSQPGDRFTALVRRPDWEPPQPDRGCGGRVEVLRGDVTLPHLGLGEDEWSELRASLTGILHCAATTRFSTPMEEAARVNVEGTRRVVELAEHAPRLRRFGHVSTTYVAGCRAGTIRETELEHCAGFVNAYEWSKYEAERLIRGTDLPWSIYRLGAILGSAETGLVRQINGVYCVIRYFYQGLVPVLAGYADTLVDLIPDEFAAAALHRLYEDFVPGATYQLCAGAENAVTVREFFELSSRGFACVEPRWPERGICPPRMVDSPGYTAYEQAARAAGDRGRARAADALKHFVPQLLYPKAFDHTACDGALSGTDIACPPVASYLPRVAGRYAERGPKAEIRVEGSHGCTSAV